MAKNPPKKEANVKNGSSQAAAAGRRAIFIDAYLSNGQNATQAAIACGLSEKTAHSAGERMLRHVEVKGEIAKRAKDLAEKYALTSDLAARSIVQDITFDPGALFDASGQLRPIAELSPDVRMSLISIEVEQAGSPDAPIFVRKYKWASKAAAREQLMKHLGMFEADNKQRQVVNLIDLSGR